MCSLSIRLIQCFRLIIIVLVYRCIKSHEKLKKGGFAVEIIGIVGEIVLDEMKAPIGIFLHGLHQHINSFAGGHVSLFQGDEINVGAGDKGGKNVLAKFRLRYILLFMA